MRPILLAIILLCPFSACKERKPVEDIGGETETLNSNDLTTDSADPAPSVAVDEAQVKVEPVTIPEEPKSPPPMAPVVLVKPAAKYNEYCSFAKKLETSESTIKLSTENFGFKAEEAAVETMQCLVTLDASIPKGKRLVPVIQPQSYFTGLGMFTTGQSLQIDVNVLTLAGDSIEASMEYQAVAAGPIANDTEFVRSLQLMRRISPPCQIMEGVKRTLAIFIILTVNKGTAAALPPVITREIPRVDYVLENCSVS